ncbi:DUF4145 domain-containing protein [Arsukibacterium perlucidum]|uniref:DUF4145 domain-containing protein n=1 Tax=Arsukibacterium perlucidum TaxID=368811 RepID=UPI00036291DB|nr:DUF4145 domain-containing protein [Arsukibacterium perlucidum]
MIKSLENTHIGKWQRIANFISVVEYPVLNCPYCGEEQLYFDPESIDTRPVTKDMADSICKKYRQAKEENKKPSVLLDELGDANGWAKLFGIGLVFAEVIVKQQDAINGLPHLMTGYLTCHACDGSVAASGMQVVAEATQSRRQTTLVKVEHFTPTLSIIPVSNNVPEPIKIELLDAFKHFHFDPPSSASKLRRAIEQFCKDMKLQGKGLHQQISSLRQIQPELADYLEPLKLIGNEGTHASDVSEIDLLHAFEVFQFVLEYYDRQARYKQTQANYKKLMDKYGPKQEVPKLENKAAPAVKGNKQQAVANG